MKTEEYKKKDIEEVCREELNWAEKVYEDAPLDAWISGYRNALRTVLREANRNVLTEKYPVRELCKEDIKEEFEASPKIRLEIEQFTDDQMRTIAKDIGELLIDSYWSALREAVEEVLNK